MKASAKSLVPKKAAFVISRISPRILEPIVNTERLRPERSKFFFLDIILENNSIENLKQSIKGTKLKLG